MDGHWDPEKSIQALSQEREVRDLTHEELARQILADNTPGAAASVAQLAMFSPDESVRLRASQYVLDRVLGRPTQEGDNAGAKDDFFVQFMSNVVSAQNLTEEPDLAANAAPTTTEP